MAEQQPCAKTLGGQSCSPVLGDDSLFRLRFPIATRVWAVPRFAAAFSAELSVVERGAIGEHDLVGASCRVARLCLVEITRDHIPRLHGTFAPADKLQRLGTSRLAGPM